jgi:hypothetical protein
MHRACRPDDDGELAAALELVLYAKSVTGLLAAAGPWLAPAAMRLHAQQVWKPWQAQV